MFLTIGYFSQNGRFDDDKIDVKFKSTAGPIVVSLRHNPVPSLAVNFTLIHLYIRT